MQKRWVSRTKVDGVLEHRGGRIAQCSDTNRSRLRAAKLAKLGCDRSDLLLTHTGSTGLAQTTASVAVRKLVEDLRNMEIRSGT
jgi:hypothetical protein